MLMLKKVVPFFFLLILLVGCQSNTEDEFIFPEVEFSLNPTTAKVNEPITFTAKIIAGDKNVEDADVRFEFWMDGQAEAEHVTTPINHQGEGIYTLEKGFNTPGTYFMYYHADALSMHMMEKYEFTITE